MATFVKELRALVFPNGSKNPADWYSPLTHQKRRKISDFVRVADRMPMLLDSRARVEIPVRRTMWDAFSGRNPTRVIESPADRRKQLAEDFIAIERVLPIFDEVAHSKAKPFQHKHFQILTVAGATEEHLKHVVKSLNQATAALKKHFPEVLYGKVFISPSRQARRRAAYYTPANDAFYINVNVTPSKSTTHTIVHELGHRYEYWFAPKALHQAVEDYAWGYKPPVSLYAKRVPSETFAECFMLYVMGEPMPPQLKKLFAAATKKRQKKLATPNAKF